MSDVLRPSYVINTIQSSTCPPVPELTSPTAPVRCPSEIPVPSRQDNLDHVVRFVDMDNMPIASDAEISTFRDRIKILSKRGSLLKQNLSDLDMKINDLSSKRADLYDELSKIDLAIRSMNSLININDSFLKINFRKRSAHMAELE